MIKNMQNSTEESKSQSAMLFGFPLYIELYSS